MAKEVQVATEDPQPPTIPVELGMDIQTSLPPQVEKSHFSQNLRLNHGSIPDIRLRPSPCIEPAGKPPQYVLYI
jgi:hypothetical protein